MAVVDEGVDLGRRLCAVEAAWVDEGILVVKMLLLKADILGIEIPL